MTTQAQSFRQNNVEDNVFLTHPLDAGAKSLNDNDNGLLEVYEFPDGSQICAVENANFTSRIYTRTGNYPL